MKRKQKRFLQMTLLFMVAVIFLPSIGLWSLYKDKHLVKSTEPGEQQVSAALTWERSQEAGEAGEVAAAATASRCAASLGSLPSLCRADVTGLQTLWGLSK